MPKPTDARAPEDSKSSPFGELLGTSELLKIQTMAEYGMPVEAIAACYGTSARTLTRNALEAIEKGRAFGAQRRARAMATCCEKATEDPRYLPALIFAMKARDGWRVDEELKIQTGPEVSRVEIHLPAKPKSREPS